MHRYLVPTVKVAARPRVLRDMANNNKLDLVTSDLFNDQVTLGLLTILGKFRKPVSRKALKYYLRFTLYDLNFTVAIVFALLFAITLGCVMKPTDFYA